MPFYQINDTCWCAIAKCATTSIAQATGAKEIHFSEAYLWPGLRWTVVRNPYSRLHSYWRAFEETRTFSECVTKACSTPDAASNLQCMSQAYRLTGFKPQLVLRFESLRYTWPGFAQLIRVPASLPVLSQSRRDIDDHDEHLASYTPELAEMVTKRYRNDLLEYDYPELTL